MAKFTSLKSRAIPLIINDIDTDQIIPARFLKVTTKTGLGKKLFSDWRYDQNEKPKPDFILNQPEYDGVQIMLAGNNFGCGSSREHAPWALTDFGIKAVISTSFADIFQNNALKNGLLPIVVNPENHRILCDYIEEIPRAEIAIDLETQTLTLPNGITTQFPIDPFAKSCLLRGVDQLGYILSFEERIEQYETNRNV
mgnify:CR=1 FL=1|jgi:3-isopropylmalate/(R)-2-methylmalate dehydratase small subunit